MKTKIIQICIFGCLIAQSTYAAILPVCTPSVCATDISLSNVINNCSSYSDNCYNGTKIRTCNTCNSGYTRTKQTTSVSTCSGTITYYNCVSSGGGGTIDPIGPIDCDGTCDDCFSSRWKSSGTAGYQTRTVATCNTITCKCSKKTEYRCAAGYYGTPPAIQQIGNLTGCTECPPTSDGAARTSAAGSTANTRCYIANGASFSDTSGSGKYTNSCYYSN